MRRLAEFLRADPRLVGLGRLILYGARARNIGITGYAGILPVAALLLVILLTSAASAGREATWGVAPADAETADSRAPRSARSISREA